MLLSIKAEISCDKCGTNFSVGIEPSEKPPKDWTMFDMAIDAVRGSLYYKGPTTVAGFLGVSSVKGDKCLCGTCTDRANKGIK